MSMLGGFDMPPYPQPLDAELRVWITHRQHIMLNLIAFGHADMLDCDDPDAILANSLLEEQPAHSRVHVSIVCGRHG